MRAAGVINDKVTEPLLISSLSRLLCAPMPPFWAPSTPAATPPPTI